VKRILTFFFVAIGASMTPALDAARGWGAYSAASGLGASLWGVSALSRGAWASRYGGAHAFRPKPQCPMSETTDPDDYSLIADLANGPKVYGRLQFECVIPRKLRALHRTIDAEYLSALARRGMTYAMGGQVVLLKGKSGKTYFPYTRYELGGPMMSLVRVYDPARGEVEKRDYRFGTIKRSPANVDMANDRLAGLYCFRRVSRKGIVMLKPDPMCRTLQVRELPSGTIVTPD